MQKFLYNWRGFFSGLATLAFLGVTVLGGFWVYNYTVPLFFGDPMAAAQSNYGDPALAYYNAALSSYRAQDFDGAIKLASQAYSSLAQANGAIASGERAQREAAAIQFLLGLCRDKNKQESQAIDAYEQALRHNPDHLAAKYNLERLLKPQGGGGAGGPGPHSGGQAGGQSGGGVQGRDAAGGQLPGQVGAGQQSGQSGQQPGQKPGGGASHQGKKGI